jgi:hypothetical protein
MSMYDRDTLLRDLKEHVVEVTFTKVNGEKRVMRCTLRGEHLPPNTDMNHLSEEHKKEQNANIIACWDVHNGGWRSFRIDSVEYVQIIDGY